MATTPLPPTGHSYSEAHVQMSHRLLEQARQELNLGDRIQASEKAWGAAAHILKAIAIQRGWRHYSHPNVIAVGSHIVSELGRDDLGRCLVMANQMHRNFYENDVGRYLIGVVIGDVETFVAEMEDVLRSSPKRYTVQDEEDQHRLALLLGYPAGYLIPEGAYSNVGFSKRHADADADAGAFPVNDPPPVS